MREGDELDVDEVAIFFAHAQDGFDMFSPTAPSTMTWLRMAAAMADAEIELVPRPLRHRRGGGKVLRLEGDALVHVETVGAGNVRAPGIAIERCRDGYGPRRSRARRGRRRGRPSRPPPAGAGWRDRRNAPVLDGNVLAGAAVEARVQEGCVKCHFGSFQLADFLTSWTGPEWAAVAQTSASLVLKPITMPGSSAMAKRLSLGIDHDEIGGVADFDAVIPEVHQPRR